MILHIFNIKIYQINIPLIEDFIDISIDCTENQKFILYGECNNSIRAKYESLFKDSRNLDFYYIKNITSLYLFLRKNKGERCILHGLTYDVMLCVLVTGIKTNWVCWGAGASINKSNPKSIIFTPIKKYIYNHFKTVVVLLSGDKVTLERDFNVKNIIILPYYSHIAIAKRNFYVELINNRRTEYNGQCRKKILLGNSAHNIPSYYELLYKLRQFRSEIEIHCMMQYPNIGQDEMNNFICKADAILGENIIVDRVMMNHEEYMQYMNGYDIYLCGNNNQSGLGAISACLRLGKKVFLTGKNYEWISSLGYEVFDVKSLNKMDSETFLEDLSIESQKKHFDMLYEELLSYKKQWIEYLNLLPITY